MTAVHWTVAYLGRPWVSGAAGPDAFDCWGLVRAVYRDRLGIEIPRVDCDGEDLRAVLSLFCESREFESWVEVDNPRDLDACLMTQHANPSHVGVYLDADYGRVLHAAKGVGVTAVDLMTLRDNGFKVVRWYRHKRLMP